MGKDDCSAEKQSVDLEVSGANQQIREEARDCKQDTEER